MKAIQGPTTCMITDGKTDRTVHINRLRKWIQSAPTLSESSDYAPYEVVWNPPMIEHDVVETEEERWYSQHNKKLQTIFISSLRTSSIYVKGGKCNNTNIAQFLLLYLLINESKTDCN